MNSGSSPGSDSGDSRHVVLVSPEIHWNTGNIGRTCLGAGAALHLIRPLGFSLDSRQLRRAGLDYWPQVPLTVWSDAEQFFREVAPPSNEVCLFSKTGAHSFRRMPCLRRMYLIFGSETQGLPEAIHQRFPGASYHIPIREAVRSLNLSTAVGIALYESLRDMPLPHDWPVEPLLNA
jgi:tRNA (cytidine/uridine-2'-O-)-methyltransferase